jgi:xanthine dehydrogenase YagS FAD-binding subunit
MNKFAFVDCTTVDQALGQFSDGASFKAGGIDLLT